MIISHNCCIKLVPLIIFIYDARSHIHHIETFLNFSMCLKFWLLDFSITLYYTHSANVKIGYMIIRENKTVVWNILNVKDISSSKVLVTSTKPQGVTSEKTIIFNVGLKYTLAARTREVGVPLSGRAFTMERNQFTKEFLRYGIFSVL